MKNYFRISIATLLLVITLVAGYFAGLQRGYNHGRAQWSSLPTYTKTYPVNTIVMAKLENQPSNPSGGVTEATFTPIVDEIKAEVFPHIWDADSTTRIHVFVPNLSIIVSGNAAVHHEIERHLALQRLNAKHKIVDYQNPE